MAEQMQSLAGNAKAEVQAFAKDVHKAVLQAKDAFTPASQYVWRQRAHDFVNNVGVGPGDDRPGAQALVNNVSPQEYNVNDLSRMLRQEYSDLKTCERDYDARCPFGWSDRGTFCQPPAGRAAGRCSPYQHFERMSHESKMAWERNCDGNFPCKDHSSCQQDWSQPCPAGWYTPDEGATCEAPAEYAKHATCPSKIANLGSLSVQQKAYLGKLCQVRWPCVGEDRHSNLQALMPSDSDANVGTTPASSSSVPFKTAGISFSGHAPETPLQSLPMLRDDHSCAAFLWGKDPPSSTLLPDATLSSVGPGESPDGQTGNSAWDPLFGTADPSDSNTSGVTEFHQVAARPDSSLDVSAATDFSGSNNLPVFATDDTAHSHLSPAPALATHADAHNVCCFVSDHSLEIVTLAAAVTIVAAANSNSFWDLCTDFGVATGAIEARQVSCPQGHVLRRQSTIALDWTCDVCKENIHRGTTLRSCRQCNFDVCPSCVPEDYRAPEPLDLAFDPEGLRPQGLLDPDSEASDGLVGDGPRASNSP